tara:strand:- start:9050 stop:10270 length:1221 start_codon:yes stop_codon:yes gene_type:complete
MKNKLSKLFISFLILFSCLFILRFFLNNRNIKILNEIYFQLPFVFNSKKICKNYQNLIEASFDNSYSVTIIDNKGTTIGSLKENKLRIPASNLKLFSTAYVIDKFNVSDKINTSIYKDKLNNFYLIGSGDPDLTLYEIENLIKSTKINRLFKFNIVEINRETKWPSGWTESDKLYSYGSPITSLAINSNQNKTFDIYYLKRRIENQLKYYYPSNNIEVSILEYDNKYPKNLKLVNKITSNPILSLITLANSESHNFTAEILFKNASKSWNHDRYSNLKIWLKRKGLPVKNINIKDASGLSRENRITTKLTALLLHKMKFNKQFNFYNSSLSILGIRGTLSNKMKNTNIKGRFFGKTGTLSNVFALSGYLYKDKEKLSISIIQNSNKIEIDNAFRFIKNLYNLEKCY